MQGDALLIPPWSSCHVNVAACLSNAMTLSPAPPADRGEKHLFKRDICVNWRRAAGMKSVNDSKLKSNTSLALWPLVTCVYDKHQGT